jgi:hypothetical protein
VIQSINTSAGSKAGSEMDVIVEIKNVGKGADNRSFSLLVNGNKTASKDVFLEPGETKKTIIKYRPEKEGLYTFEAEGQQKQTAVAEGDNYLMLIGVLVLILLLIGGGLYLHKSGELNKLREQIKKK